MNLTEKAAYLKGLVEGLGVDESSKEGKIFKVIVELLDDITLSVADLEDGVAEISEQVDAIDEDLEELEDDYYSFEEDDDDDEYDDEELYEVVCPNCGDTVCVDESMLDEGHINCPNCNELLEFDFDCDCDDCNCEEEEDK